MQIPLRILRRNITYTLDYGLGCYCIAVTREKSNKFVALDPECAYTMPCHFSIYEDRKKIYDSRPSLEERFSSFVTSYTKQRPESKTLDELKESNQALWCLFALNPSSIAEAYYHFLCQIGVQTPNEWFGAVRKGETWEVTVWGITKPHSYSSTSLPLSMNAASYCAADEAQEKYPQFFLTRLTERNCSCGYIWLHCFPGGWRIPELTEEIAAMLPFLGLRIPPGRLIQDMAQGRLSCKIWTHFSVLPNPWLTKYEIGILNNLDRKRDVDTTVALFVLLRISPFRDFDRKKLIRIYEDGSYNGFCHFIAVNSDHTDLTMNASVNRSGIVGFRVLFRGIQILYGIGETETEAADDGACKFFSIIRSGLSSIKDVQLFDLHNRVKYLDC
jgi:hypothetical protein